MVGAVHRVVPRLSYRRVRRNGALPLFKPSPRVASQGNAGDAYT